MTDPSFSSVIAKDLFDLPSLPKVEIRFSALQGESLHYGVKKVAITCLNVATGHRPNPRVPMCVYPPNGDCYQAFIACIGELWKALYPIITQPRRRRARLDVFQISACALVVRASAKHERHGHFRISSERPAAVRERLLALLEGKRRSAMAAAVNEIGRERYRQLHHFWLRFAKWLRFFALDCRCGKPFRVVHHRHLWRAILNDTLAVARRELSECNVEVPEDKLRHWVRQAISNVRRGRGLAGIPCLFEQTGAYYIRHYLLRRIHEEDKYELDRSGNEHCTGEDQFFTPKERIDADKFFESAFQHRKSETPA